MNIHIGEVYAITAIVSALLTGLVYGRMKLALSGHAIEPSFINMLRFFILFNMVDALWGLCCANIIVSPPLFTAVGYCYHLLSSASAFVWALYVIQYIRNKARLHRAFLSVALFLFACQLAFIFSNPFHHLVFNVSENNEYTIHALRYVLYGLQMSYYILILSASAVMSRCDEMEQRSKHRANFSYSLVLALFCFAQFIFYDVALYSLGFAYVALLICLYRQSFRIEQLMQEQLKTVSQKQLSIIRNLAGKIMAIFYVDIQTGHYDRFVSADNPLGLEVSHVGDRNFFHAAREWGSQCLADDDLETFLLIMNREYIVRTLEQQSEISRIIRVKQGDKSIYHEGRITRLRNEVDPNKIIVAVCDIDERYREQIRHSEEVASLDAAAHRDSLTGLLNRHAYEDDLYDMGGKPDAADFVYVSLDVNGLKAVNDDLGHDAGDELIRGAALCMKQCFDAHGKVYRHGGDEFAAILHTESDNLEALFARFEEVVAEWHGKRVNSLAISYGYATAQEAPEASVEELEKLADQRMYDYKMRYYARKGIDRRAQQEAYDALRESYTKVLKLDLATDSFTIIKTDERELDSRKGFSDKFSEWVYSFAKAGNVHESDIEEYLQKTNLEYLRNYFANPNSNLAFRYRRKNEDGFGETMMEIIPAHNFAIDNQIVFLYVKKVSGDGLYMRLQEVREDMELTVQMQWDNNILEFPSSMVKKDERGIYITPYIREERALQFDVFLTDDIHCNLFALVDRCCSRAIWHDVELESVKTAEGMLYRVSTRDFNQYSRPAERRVHRRTASGVVAQVSDMAFTTAEVVLHDISDTGVSFHATEPIGFTSDIINIKFADTIRGERFCVNTSAKVIRDYTEQGKTFYGCLVVEPPRDYQLYVFMRKLSSREKLS